MLFVKIKHLSEDTIKRVGEGFSQHISNNFFLSRIHKEPLKIRKKKTDNSLYIYRIAKMKPTGNIKCW